MNTRKISRRAQIQTERDREEETYALIQKIVNESYVFLETYLYLAMIHFIKLSLTHCFLV